MATVMKVLCNGCGDIVEVRNGTLQNAAAVLL